VVSLRNTESVGGRKRRSERDRERVKEGRAGSALSSDASVQPH